jgi:hypothetical protein
MRKILNILVSLKCILQKVFPVQKGFKNTFLWTLYLNVASLVPLSPLKKSYKKAGNILYFVYLYMYKNMKYTYARMYYSFRAV